MRPVFLVTLFVLGSLACRGRRDAGGDLHPESGGSPEDARPAAPSRFAGPLGAARLGDDLLVAAQRRTGGEIVATLLAAPPRTTDAGPVSLQTSFQRGGLSVFGSVTGAAVLVNGYSDAGGGSLLHFLRRAEHEIRALPPVDAGEALCTTLDGVATLHRIDTGWKAGFWSSASEAPPVDGPTAQGRAEGVLVCAMHRVFVVATGEDLVRAIAWDPLQGKEWPPIVLGKPETADDDDDVVMTSDGDSLVVVRSGNHATISLLGWRGDSPPSEWVHARLGGGEVSLEAVEATHEAVGVVVTQSIEGGKGCPGGGDASDTVAQMGIVGRDGRIAHPLERIETWRCGAEAGPFWGGWIGDRFAVLWPRGVDAACARAGVRYGGVGFAIADRVRGKGVRIGRAGRPAEALAHAGCDDQRCYVAAVTRGPNACGPGDAPEAGALEIVAVP